MRVWLIISLPQSFIHELTLTPLPQASHIPLFLNVHKTNKAPCISGSTLRVQGWPGTRRTRVLYPT